MLYITTLHNSGGRTGHQFKDQLAAYTIAHLFGLQYVHTPNKSIDFFNLGHNEIQLDEVSCERVIIEETNWSGHKYERIQSIIENIKNKFRDRDCLILLSRATRIQLYQLPKWYENGLIKEDAYENIININKEKYFIGKNAEKKNIYSPEKINIAVHIRRGDTARFSKRIRCRFRDNPYSNHFCFPALYYWKIVQGLKKILREYPYEVHVFTEKDNSIDVKLAFKYGKNVFLHIGGTIEDDIYNLITSDIFVMSNSSFSTGASYISDALKIFHPNEQFKNMPKDEFLPVDISGNLSKYQEVIRKFASQKKI